MNVVVSQNIEPNPDWWVRPHWWMDEGFRMSINAGLFQAFGHRVKHPFYKAASSAFSLSGLGFGGRQTGMDTIITNEAGKQLLKSMSEAL